MKVEDYTFTQEAIELLQKYRDEQGDTRLQRRFLALLMLAEGLKVEMVKKLLGISYKTIERWFNMYYQRGIQSLNSFQYQPKPSSLSLEEAAQLKDWVKKSTWEP